MMTIRRCSGEARASQRRLRGKTFRLWATLGALATLFPLLPSPASAQWQEWRDRDRGGGGIPLSMFATFVEPGEFLVYPFFEYYRDSDMEYEAADLGYGDTTERQGAYRASEGLIFLGYGISDRWALEFEAAVISARLEKDPEDDSAMPDVVEESGLGDVEGQLRYRWRQETEQRSEIFSYFETVLPLQKKKKLIGTPGWEFKLGTGIQRTRSWGTLTFRGAVAFDEAESKLELGEYAVEYVRGLSDALRVYAGVEGSEDELELITEVQVSLVDNVVLKLNNALGVTPKATDWAPELGIVFRFH